jgi:hypothetical protein
MKRAAEDGKNPAGAVADGRAKTPAPIVVPAISAAAPVTDPGAWIAFEIILPLTSLFLYDILLHMMDFVRSLLLVEKANLHNEVVLPESSGNFSCSKFWKCKSFIIKCSCPIGNLR